MWQHRAECTYRGPKTQQCPDNFELETALWTCKLRWFDVSFGCGSTRLEYHRSYGGKPIGLTLVLELIKLYF